jgi:hypothetical protein
VVIDYVTVLAGRIRSFVPEDRLPDEPYHDRLFRLYAVLALAKGPATSAEDVHNAWVAWMAELDPDHPSLRPYGELTPADQREDLPYLQAIRDALSDHPE